MMIQYILNKTYKANITVDGDFGPATFKALKQAYGSDFKGYVEEGVFTKIKADVSKKVNENNILDQKKAKVDKQIISLSKSIKNNNEVASIFDCDGINIVSSKDNSETIGGLMIKLNIAEEMIHFTEDNITLKNDYMLIHKPNPFTLKVVKGKDDKYTISTVEEVNSEMGVVYSDESNVISSALINPKIIKPILEENKKSDEKIKLLPNQITSREVLNKSDQAAYDKKSKLIDRFSINSKDLNDKVFWHIDFGLGMNDAILESLIYNYPKVFTSAKKINLANSSVTNKSISNLLDLSNLEYLSFLGNNNITSISGLKGHKNLSSLDLSQTKVSDISIITTLPGLKNLDLSLTPLDKRIDKKLKTMQRYKMLAGIQSDKNFLKLRNNNSDIWGAYKLTESDINNWNNDTKKSYNSKVEWDERDGFIVKDDNITIDQNRGFDLFFPRKGKKLCVEDFFSWLGE